jgi:choline dehydrogenase-like flavoprotein
MLVDAPVRTAARDAGSPWFRAGIVEHGGAAGPIVEAVHLPPGEIHTQLMLESTLRDRLWVFTVQGEDLPQATNRIDLDPHVRDVWGTPAGRVTYQPHRHEVAASRYYAPKLEAILNEMGAAFTITTTSPPLPGDPAAALGPTPTSRHIIGTCRMGNDPATSVVDAWSRFHDVENMVCADSSVFPTSAGYGPTLTLVALAIRACRALAGQEQLRSVPPR